MLSRIFPRLSPRVSALPTPVKTMSQRSHIFTPMDWMFYYFPNYSRDKVALMARQIKIHFAIGFALVFFVYHPPYKGADYENFHKSPLYWYKYNKLERSGQLQENLRIKRDWFYDEDPNAS
ncbi:hypothetical protein FOZ63_034059 [Perkinsus olseni]|uniref:Uncharacterized protein n=1 Tax=Perkinsus olseni TaxID=32597 RepID=A0A7J6R0Q9_PEROL|nr:hypothetical protein FOZ63_034059 [Perkinsus olseni]